MERTGLLKSYADDLLYQEYTKELHILSSTIALFNADTIEQLQWPDTVDGIYAKSYLMPLIQQGSTHFIENVQTTPMVLVIDGRIVLPITLNEQEYANSYVCSPYSQYVTYAKEELVLIQQEWLRHVLSFLIDGFGLLCKGCRINRVVHVNNWLLSTNLYPDLTSEHIAVIITFLKDQFPQHTIIFRSINSYSNELLTTILQKAGSRLVPSRQVYFVHPSKQSSFRTKARWRLKRDFALLERQGYGVIGADELREGDVPRLVALYNALYLEKYSYNNPMFNEQFIKLALSQKTLQLVALKKGERIDAVLGYFCRNGVMTTPIFGYDTTLPQAVGLYRMLTAVLFKIAQENEHLINHSSGAAEFKRNRGAIASIEYSAVYDQHLPLYRRFCWIVLCVLLEKIGVPLMKKYKL
jgi:hypothetical protein